MTTVYDRSCLTTVVRNTSGGTRKFAYLPGHGRELADDEEFTIVGDLFAALRATKAAERKINALLADLESGDLTIVHTPLPLAYDATDDQTQVIGIDSGALSLADPCWLTSLSEV